MRVELTNGNWAELKEPETLRNRDRKALLLAIDGIEGNVAKALAMSDALLERLVVEWSLDLPLPTKGSDSLDELLPGDADILFRNCESARDALFPSFDVDPDPKVTVDN